ncbi:unnamed protein product [Rotaria sordida]|uniref:Uncharacterized protein n=1 Tax=Rotaria sordida TaxID=392033 RepID=A0A813XXY1_9BILA|nr:unnamed protein product [Rotaria sordida]
MCRSQQQNILVNQKQSTDDQLELVPYDLINGYHENQLLLNQIKQQLTDIEQKLHDNEKKLHGNEKKLALINEEIVAMKEKFLILMQKRKIQNND